MNFFLPDDGAPPLSVSWLCGNPAAPDEMTTPNEALARSITRSANGPVCTICTSSAPARTPAPASRRPWSRAGW